MSVQHLLLSSQLDKLGGQRRHHQSTEILTNQINIITFSPVVWDDGQTVASLGVPNPNLSCQATASQQHPVTGQTLDVLQDRKTEHQPNEQPGLKFSGL